MSIILHIAGSLWLSSLLSVVHCDGFWWCTAHLVALLSGRSKGPPPQMLHFHNIAELTWSFLLRCYKQQHNSDEVPAWFKQCTETSSTVTLQWTIRHKQDMNRGSMKQRNKAWCFLFRIILGAHTQDPNQSSPESDICFPKHIIFFNHDKPI